MDETKKTGATTPSGAHPGGPGGSAQGSGSDTVSAAKVASGATPGAPRPGGTHDTGGQAGGLGGSGAQSATLASHTSRPLGGAAASSGTGASAGSSGSAAGSRAGQGGAAGTGGASTQGAGAAVRDFAGDVQRRASEAYEEATDWAQDTYRDASNWVSGSGSGRQSYRSGQQGSSVQTFVSDNPVLVGVVGLAAGLLLGALLPRTRREDQMLGRWSDEVRDQGLRYARDMTQRGREYVEHAFDDDHDAAFATPGQDRQRDDQRRSGPSGRYQNH